jgi:hypothetical protein
LLEVLARQIHRIGTDKSLFWFPNCVLNHGQFGSD